MLDAGHPAFCAASAVALELVLTWLPASHMSMGISLHNAQQAEDPAASRSPMPHLHAIDHHHLGACGRSVPPR